MALFESYERRIGRINEVLAQHGLGSLEEARQLVEARGVDVYGIVKGIQSICFENVCWAYILGAAIALKKGQSKAVEIATSLGEGMQAFCIPGSVAEDRKVGIGHGNLASMLLKEETKCFAFLAGHESFAAAEGAIGLARSANKARREPLRVILNGLGKDAAQIISKINALQGPQLASQYGERAASIAHGLTAVMPGGHFQLNAANDVLGTLMVQNQQARDFPTYYNNYVAKYGTSIGAEQAFQRDMGPVYDAEQKEIPKAFKRTPTGSSLAEIIQKNPAAIEKVEKGGKRPEGSVVNGLGDGFSRYFR